MGAGLDVGLTYMVVRCPFGEEHGEGAGGLN